MPIDLLEMLSGHLFLAYTAACHHGSYVVSPGTARRVVCRPLVANLSIAITTLQHGGGLRWPWDDGYEVETRLLFHERAFVTFGRRAHAKGQILMRPC